MAVSSALASFSSHLADNINIPALLNRLEISSSGSDLSIHIYLVSTHNQGLVALASAFIVILFVDFRRELLEIKSLSPSHTHYALQADFTSF